MTSITTIKKKFDAELLFTVQSEDNYEEFFKHKHLFDFSNFPKDLKFYDSENEMVVGKMKVVKFVGLK